jgi:hypothetical protein
MWMNDNHVPNQEFTSGKKLTAPHAESMSLPLPLKFPRPHSVSVETEIEAGLQPKYAWLHAPYFK